MAAQPDRGYVAAGGRVMERTTFLKNYRIRLKYDGSPYEPDRSGPAISYEAVDDRTGEPVSVTLIPAESIDPAERQQFEEHVSAAQKLRHVNVAKVFDFQREGDDYVYVSERLVGETLASWVSSHGPMPADAALRVGEQIVSVLSSAGFHKLPYPSIQPSDVVLVPGQTPEGTWPFVKVTNFGLPALKALPADNAAERQPTPPDGLTTRADTQPFGQPTMDIGSEIYSLGVTLYFLLSGAALSVEALEHGPKLSGFPKPLRLLLGRLLHRDPDQRPKDLLVVTEMLRSCSEKIERRRVMSDRYGIPLRTTVDPSRTARPRRLVRTAVAAGLLLLVAAVIAPLVFRDSIGKMLGISRKQKPIGVLIGVPESLAPAVAQAPQTAATTPSAVAGSPPVNPTIAPQAEAQTNAATTPNPFHVAQADVEPARMAGAQQQVAGSPASAETPAVAAPDSSGSAAGVANANSTAKANAAPARSNARESSSQGTKKSVVSTSRRTRAGQSSETSPRGRTGSVRSRVVGITSDGRLILRLPSGRTAIVAPDEEDSGPRRHRNRVPIDRDQMFGLPPGSEPDYSPYD